MGRADIEYLWHLMKIGYCCVSVIAVHTLLLAVIWVSAWKMPRAQGRYRISRWGHLVLSLQEAQARRNRAQRVLQDGPRRRPASTNKRWSCFEFAKGCCCIPMSEAFGSIVRRRRRDNIQSEVFRFCDQDGDGVLNQWEMLLLAREAGFHGDDQKWNNLYTQFCGASGRRPEQGIDEVSVKSLLDDESEAGFYCPDDLLKTMVRNLLYTIANRARAKMKSSLFILCDADGDGVLNSEETLRLARLTGFDGHEWEWNEDFRLLCNQFGRSPAQGLDQVSLMRLLEDKANWFYCNDDGLQSLISSLSRMMEQDCCVGSQCGAYSRCHPAFRDFSQWLYGCCLLGGWGDRPRAR